MLRATANQLLPTTITGSLPRPSWYTENMGLKSFLQAMVETRFREQYEDALSVYLNEQMIRDGFAKGTISPFKTSDAKGLALYEAAQIRGEVSEKNIRHDIGRDS